MLNVRLFPNIKLSREENSCVCYLTEFREVVLLAEGTLPQPRGIVADCLVVTLSLRPSVSDTSHYTGDQLTWRKGRQKNINHTSLLRFYIAGTLNKSCAVTTSITSQAEC